MVSKTHPRATGIAIQVTMKNLRPYCKRGSTWLRLLYHLAETLPTNQELRVLRAGIPNAINNFNLPLFCLSPPTIVTKHIKEYLEVSVNKGFTRSLDEFKTQYSRLDREARIDNGQEQCKDCARYKTPISGHPSKSNGGKATIHLGICGWCH